jgi:hypothetical protein
VNVVSALAWLRVFTRGMYSDGHVRVTSAASQDSSGVFKNVLGTSYMYIKSRFAQERVAAKDHAGSWAPHFPTES